MEKRERRGVERCKTMSTAARSKMTKDYEVGFWRKRKVRALDGLSLSVGRGEIFGFLGANGAGKTTTLKLLMRLMYPTAGRASILGRDIGDVSTHARIGYLPEHPYFYDYLTAREFLEYCAELFGYSRAERKGRAADMLARVRLDEKSWDKQLRKFSKGMLQRVGLAQALVNVPEVVFSTSRFGLARGPRECATHRLPAREGARPSSCSHILSHQILATAPAVLRKSLAHSRDRQLPGSVATAMEVVVRGGSARASRSGDVAVDGAGHVARRRRARRVRTERRWRACAPCARASRTSLDPPSATLSKSCSSMTGLRVREAAPRVDRAEVMQEAAHPRGFPLFWIPLAARVWLLKIRPLSPSSARGHFFLLIPPSTLGVTVLFRSTPVCRFGDDVGALLDDSSPQVVSGGA